MEGIGRAFHFNEKTDEPRGDELGGFLQFVCRLGCFRLHSRVRFDVDGAGGRAETDIGSTCRACGFRQPQVRKRAVASEEIRAGRSRVRTHPECWSDGTGPGRRAIWAWECMVVDGPVSRGKRSIRRLPEGSARRHTGVVGRLSPGRAFLSAWRFTGGSKALEAFTSGTTDHPSLELAWTYLGDTCFGLDDLPGARVAYERSLAAYPRGRTGDRARYGLARALAAAGRARPSS